MEYAAHLDKLKIKVQDESTTTQDITRAYDAVADNYDEFYDQHFKYDLGIVASELSALQGAQKDGRVLDVAAGTGLLALELRNRGFTNVDGLDASQIMLDVAQKKCLYVNTFCRWFTSDPSEGMEMDSYDAVISTGSFTKKHLHPSCLIEFLRLAKPGGLVVIGISESTYDTLKEFESVLEECIKARRCDLLKKTRYECFNFNKKPGFVFAIQKN